MGVKKNTHVTVARDRRGRAPEASHAQSVTRAGGHALTIAWETLIPLLPWGKVNCGGSRGWKDPLAARTSVSFSTMQPKIVNLHPNQMGPPGLLAPRISMLLRTFAIGRIVDFTSLF
jgi:hypothetical protein